MLLLFKSCKETTELIDKQQLTPLSIVESLQLLAHKAMCKTCKAYKNQSKIIDSLIRKWYGTKESVIKNILSEQVKTDIIGKINKI